MKSQNWLRNQQNLFDLAVIGIYYFKEVELRRKELQTVLDNIQNGGIPD
jgi:hypothetical protein